MSEGVFLDTSALYAVFDADDASHRAVAEAWRDLVASDASLHTTNYVLLELLALLQRRLGVEAVDALNTYLVPFVNVLWIDERLHTQAAAALLGARRRDVSLVDHMSFVAMRRLGLRSALTVDRHFVDQGFRVVPQAS
jgi:predicted nucleic acid-binding protein